MRCNQVSISIERFGEFVPKNYPADVQRIHVYCDDFNSIYAALSKANWKVDCVLSHTCPRRYEPVEEFMSGVKQWLVDKKTENWLDEIADKLTYERWYFGHFHCNKQNGKAKILYEDIECFG